MLVSVLQKGGNLFPFPKIFRRFGTKFLTMAASNDECSEENLANGEAEQIVTMEKVVAVDNKGIDYDKLISECSLPFVLFFSFLYKAIECPRCKVLS